MLSAAEQFLKLELTKNFKVRILPSLAIIPLINFPNKNLTGDTRSGALAPIVGSRLVKRIPTTLRRICDVSDPPVGFIPVTIKY